MVWDGITQAEVEYVAVLVNNVLWGISCTQTFLYFFHFHKNDNKYIKAMVLWLLGCDTTHLILTNRGFWVDIVLSSNGFIVSEEYLWASFFTCLVALPCQLFFVYRIWNFSGRMWIIPALFIPTSVYQLAGYIAFLALNLQSVSLSEFYALQKLLKSIWGVSAVEDILITLILFYMLWKQRSGELLKQTSQLIYRVMFICLNTGTWTALTALFALITMSAWPNTFAFVSLNLVISPVYCNTLLANLNAREYLRSGNQLETHVTIMPSFRNSRAVDEEMLEVNVEVGHQGENSTSISSAERPDSKEDVAKRVIDCVTQVVKKEYAVKDRNPLYDPMTSIGKSGPT